MFGELPTYDEVDSFLRSNGWDSLTNRDRVMELFRKRYPRHPELHVLLMARYISFFALIQEAVDNCRGLEDDCLIKSILYTFYHNIGPSHNSLMLTDDTPRFFYECAKEGILWYNDPYRVYRWRDRFYSHYSEWTCCRARKIPYTVASLYDYIRLKPIMKKHQIEMPRYEPVRHYDIRGMIAYSCLYRRIAREQLRDVVLQLSQALDDVPLRTCIELAKTSSRLFG